MRLPNGFGSISKLSGKRRNPYIVRVTIGYDDNGKQIFKTLGYVKNRKAGLEMLAAYHKDPNAVDNDTTFAEVFDMLLNKKEGSISASAIRGYQSCFKYATPLHKMKMVDIKLHHLQKIIDGMTDVSHSTKSKCKTVYGLMFDIAIQNDIIEKNYAKFLDIGKKSTETSKTTYTDKEIEILWKYQGDDYVDATLVLLYTGMRISELLELKMENIHLDEQYAIGGSKTEAGKNRIIPFADKIMPIIRRLYGDGSYKSLILSPSGETFTREAFSYHWKKRMAELGIKHGLHETRHTCISNLYKTGAEPGIIRKLVGHSGKGITEQVYLHVDVQQLLDVVNKLD